MKIGDIVNVRKTDGNHWKGKITDMNDEWTHHLKDGTVLRAPYTSTIATVNEIGGVGHAVFHLKDLHLKDGEYYEREYRWREGRCKPTIEVIKMLRPGSEPLPECPICKGAGWIYSTETPGLRNRCDECEGTGQIKGDEL